MKDKKGFTLVELLAVIAILAILVIIALPNVIKMFNNAKKSSFLTEVQSVYKQSLTKSMSEEIGSNKINTITSLGTNKLDMQGKELTYCVILNEKGSPIKMAVSDGKYFFYSDLLSNISSITNEDVHEGTLTMSACTPADFGNISATASDGEIYGKLPYTLSAATYQSNTHSELAMVMNGMENSNFNSVTYKISVQTGPEAYSLVEEQTVNNKSAKFRYEYNASSGGRDYKIEAFTPDGKKIDEYIIYAYPVACFVAGTKVKTESGYKNIEDIKVGEKVYSYNLNNNNLELKEVTKTILSSSIDTYIVTIDGKTVEMSPKHQVYVIDKGWVRALNLKESDVLLDSNGNKISIEKIEYKKYEAPIKTYNLTVEGNSNYFVTNIQVLVHNAPSPMI